MFISFYANIWGLIQEDGMYQLYSSYQAYILQNQNHSIQEDL